MKTEHLIRIATRKSKLALVQSQQVADHLMALHRGLVAELVTFDTTGDAIQGQNLSEIGGKGLFTKELEDALLAGTVDMAVHSLKDMPAVLPKGLEIACIPKREDARDAFISRRYKSISDLPNGAVVGTSSTRRAAQVNALRPDVKIIPFRGNVQTRLKKLEEGVADATFLAVAGLSRLGLGDVISEILPPSAMLPAVGQGALAIEINSQHKNMRALLAPLNHVATYVCVEAERSFLKTLDGSCRTPLAAYATLNDGVLSFDCMIASSDGVSVFRTTRKGKAEDAAAMGKDAALQLKAEAGEAILAGW